MSSLQGVALVTGAARRIGAAIARELHAAGMNVAIHYRSSGGEARAIERDLNDLRPGSVCCLRANLLDAGAIERLAEQAHARWGRLDALVNNASVYYATPLSKLTLDALDELLEANLRAPLLLAQACARRMRAGAIVNLADANLGRMPAGYAAYAAAKGGLIQATAALAKELAPHIRVNAVAPGHILWAEQSGLDETQKKKELARVPLGRMGTPEEIARVVRFLTSPDSAYITGAVIPVDGGLRLA